MNDVYQVLSNWCLTVLLPGLLSVLAGFIIALAKKGFDYLTAKIEGIKNENLKCLTYSSLNDLQTIVESTVISLQQTLGDDIKASIKAEDGKYTRDDLLKLKDTALKSINSQMTETMNEAVNSITNDATEYINSLIEQTVYRLKVNK